MKRLIVTACLATLSCTSFAEPKVIYDSGNTIPINSYLNAIQSDDYAEPAQPVQQTSLVVTPEMSVGKVTKRDINLPTMTSPLFIIGTDDISNKWLNRNKSALLKMNASGMIVNTKSESDTVHTLNIASGLNMSVTSGSDLARRFKLNHYPVLITRKEITQ